MKLILLKKSSDNIEQIMAGDFGMSNIVVIYSPKLKNPIIYSGRYLLHLNMFYKKSISKLQAETKKINNKYTSVAIDDLWKSRDLQINDYFNKLTDSIIKICIENKITELILGYNIGWKNNVNLGKKTNDAFYKIPYKRLISKLFDKGEENGILVRENEESYTSKCDALSFEKIGFHETYLGKRIKRGLFQSKTKHLVNADVNGAINIFRKGIKDNTTMTKKLKDHVKTTIGDICNPIKKTFPLNAFN